MAPRLARQFPCAMPLPGLGNNTSVSSRHIIRSDHILPARNTGRIINEPSISEGAHEVVGNLNHVIQVGVGAFIKSDVMRSSLLDKTPENLSIHRMGASKGTYVKPS